MLSVNNFPNGAKQNKAKRLFVIRYRHVAQQQIIWLLLPLWENAERRFHCWAGNEDWNNNCAAQQSSGCLLDRPCLATGLHTLPRQLPAPPSFPRRTSASVSLAQTRTMGQNSLAWSKNVVRHCYSGKKKKKKKGEISQDIKTSTESDA